MKGRRNTHGVAGIGGSGAPSPLTPAPSRRGVLGTIEGLPSSLTVASLPSRPRGTSSTRSAAKVPGRGAACHRRWRLRCGDAPVARPPVPGAGEDAPPTQAARAFSSNGPDKSKAGVGASRPFGPGASPRDGCCWMASGPTSSATNRSNLLRNEAFQWFLTALSVRPGSILLISAQRLPRLWCSTSIVLTSSTVKGALETAGSSWLCHLSRHCLPVLPGMAAAIVAHPLGPRACTNRVSSASSLADHHGRSSRVGCWSSSVVKSRKPRSHRRTDPGASALTFGTGARPDRRSGATAGAAGSAASTEASGASPGKLSVLSESSYLATAASKARAASSSTSK
mmetsp:Transcript_13421/g.41321  ORF Transcript_13421/g.41321 Transcript_13421/m.41321 type:complete len:340 (-) Transcript_13421:736-1755(-)